MSRFWAVFWRFWKNLESKMVDHDGHRSDIMKQLLSHVMSSPHDVFLKGDIFRPAIYPPSLAVFSFYILGVNFRIVEDREKPGLNRDEIYFISSSLSF